jgi:CheY-like chemotaxis protein
VILLVEDNPGDAVLLQNAFETEALRVPFRIAPTVADALRQIREHRDDDLRLVIVDIRLAGGSDGWGVLEALTVDPAYSGLRAAVLTSSSRVDDRSRALALGVSHYFSKPLSLEGYVPIVRALAALHEERR